MVTEDGLVKILDFGLAKLTQPDATRQRETQAPTVTREHRGRGRDGDGRLHVAGAGDRRSRWTTGRTSSRSARSCTRWRQGGARSSARPRRNTRGHHSGRAGADRRGQSRRSRLRCAGPCSDVSRRSPEAATPRPRIWRESSRRFATTFPRPRARSGLSPAEPVPARRRWWIPAVIAAAILLALGIAGWRLRQSDYFWKNPLAGARFSRFTSWEGSELDAASPPTASSWRFSPDRDGPFDAWVGQVGSGEFLNLTEGSVPDLSPTRSVHNVGFSDDGAHVWFRIKRRRTESTQRLARANDRWGAAGIPAERR